jgi:enoyl-CoA hydratase
MTGRSAARYFLTGETFDGAAAAATGLITSADDDVDALLTTVLDGLRAGSPQGLAVSKRLTTGSVRAALAGQGRDMAELSASLFASDEAMEGMTAFLQRRPPAWVA